MSTHVCTAHVSHVYTRMCTPLNAHMTTPVCRLHARPAHIHWAQEASSRAHRLKPSSWGGLGGPEPLGRRAPSRDPRLRARLTPTAATFDCPRITLLLPQVPGGLGSNSKRVRRVLEGSWAKGIGRRGEVGGRGHIQRSLAAAQTQARTSFAASAVWS